MANMKFNTGGGGVVVGDGVATGVGSTVVVNSPGASAHAGTGMITIRPNELNEVIRALGELKYALLESQAQEKGQLRKEIASLEERLADHHRVPRDGTRALFERIKAAAGSVAPVIEAATRVMGLLGLGSL